MVIVGLTVVNYFGERFQVTATAWDFFDRIDIAVVAAAGLTAALAGVSWLTAGISVRVAAIAFAGAVAGVCVAPLIEVSWPKLVGGSFLAAAGGGVAELAAVAELALSRKARPEKKPASLPRPGWYEDPSRSAAQRWWTGIEWSDYTRTPLT